MIELKHKKLNKLEMELNWSPDVTTLQENWIKTRAGLTNNEDVLKKIMEYKQLVKTENSEAIAELINNDNILW